MRSGLIIGLLAFCTALSWIIFADNFALSKLPANEVDRVDTRASLHPTRQLHNQFRDAISVADASRLASRLFIPQGTASLLKVPAVMRHGDFVWNEQGIPKGQIEIWVDLRRQMISAFRNGHEIGTAVIVYGAEDRTSPEGRFPILNKQRHYHSRTYDAPMPASLFITNDGVARLGSPMSSRRASHGCIGLPVAFAEKLFDASSVGDIVEITRSQKDGREPLR